MLDNISQKLIRELQKDGRQGNRALARKLGVSEGTIRKRIRDLRSKNIISIVAVLNPRQLGYDFVCIMGLEVKLSDLRRVGEELIKSPNVYYLTHVTGHFDLMAIILFHNSHELAEFIQDKISTIPGIVETETFINMDIIKTPWADRLDVVELVES